MVLVADATAGRTKDGKRFPKKQNIAVLLAEFSITELRGKVMLCDKKKGVFLSPVLHFGRFISITTTPPDVIKLSPHLHRSLFLY